MKESTDANKNETNERTVSKNKTRHKRVLAWLGGCMADRLDKYKSKILTNTLTSDYWPHYHDQEEHHAALD